MIGKLILIDESGERSELRVERIEAGHGATNILAKYDGAPKLISAVRFELLPAAAEMSRHAYKYSGSIANTKMSLDPKVQLEIVLDASSSLNACRSPARFVDAATE